MPSKYEDLAQQARLEADAEIALVLIIKGKRGNGLSIASAPGAREDVLTSLLPGELRSLARVLELYGAAADPDTVSLGGPEN